LKTPFQEFFRYGEWKERFLREYENIESKVRYLRESEINKLLFYSLGKIFVPLLLHEKGVKSESFKALSPEEQEKAVSDVLDTVWENHFIRILQILPSLIE